MSSVTFQFKGKTALVTGAGQGTYFCHRIIFVKALRQRKWGLLPLCWLFDISTSKCTSAAR